MSFCEEKNIVPVGGVNAAAKAKLRGTQSNSGGCRFPWASVKRHYFKRKGLSGKLVCGLFQITTGCFHVWTVQHGLRLNVAAVHLQLITWSVQNPMWPCTRLTKHKSLEIRGPLLSLTSYLKLHDPSFAKYLTTYGSSTKYTGFE